MTLGLATVHAGAGPDSVHEETVPRRHAALVCTLLVALLAMAAARAQTADGATVDKTGWWNRANEPVASPTGPVTAPPPPDTEGRLVVSSSGAETTAIAAVGIQPDDPPGSTVILFTMDLAEDAESGSNQGTEAAALIACPITAFWPGGENGAWESRPEFDCDAASAEGTRSDDGVWSFDLAPIGELWFDSFGTIRADGVVVIPDPESNAPFQGVFPPEAITISLVTSPPPEQDEENPFAIPPPPDPPSDAGLNSGPGGGGSSSLFSPPQVTSPPTTTSAAPTATTVASTTPDDVADAGGDEPFAAPEVQEPVVSRAGDLAGNLPFAVLPGVVLLLGTLLAMSYWLGPAGQPVTTVRQRGVARALDARRRTAKEV